MDVKCNRFTPWSKGDTRLRTLSTNCRQLVRKIALDDFKKSSFKSDEFLNNVINVIKKVGIQIETNPEATEEEIIELRNKRKIYIFRNNSIIIKT